jgi:hypothetical protein
MAQVVGVLIILFTKMQLTGLYNFIRINCLNIAANAQFLNVYGPTEATVFCTAYVCDPKIQSSPPPIGKILSGNYLYPPISFPPFLSKVTQKLRKFFLRNFYTKFLREIISINFT